MIGVVWLSTVRRWVQMKILIKFLAGIFYNTKLTEYEIGDTRASKS